MQRKLSKSNPLFLIDEKLKLPKNNKHQRSQKSLAEISMPLSDIDENSKSNSKSIPKQLTYSKHLSLSTDKSNSQNIFWDESVIQDVKLLCISTSSSGKRSVQEIRISTNELDTEMDNIQETDIYDLLF
ncbi:Hypothetical_protein [Hexamita inflata]|uniref:Hypothetical_protein n=1 Tax=Hexamita inflata TaxID=28002 RepID=A0AA86NNI4_9EUKA|nr:Hypothetical protein HINF_LOCUS10449 [Hexamita inflata]